MRPVTAGYISYMDLIGDRLDLMDIALMNEALDVNEFNNG